MKKTNEEEALDLAGLALSAMGKANDPRLRYLAETLKIRYITLLLAILGVDDEATK